MQQLITPEKATEMIEIKGYRKSWVAAQVGIKADTLTRFLNGRHTLGRPAHLLLTRILGAEEKVS